MARGSANDALARRARHGRRPPPSPSSPRRVLENVKELWKEVPPGGAWARRRAAALTLASLPCCPCHARLSSPPPNARAARRQEAADARPRGAEDVSPRRLGHCRRLWRELFQDGGGIAARARAPGCLLPCCKRVPVFFDSASFAPLHVNRFECTVMCSLICAGQRSPCSCGRRRRSCAQPARRPARPAEGKGGRGGCGQGRAKRARASECERNAGRDRLHARAKRTMRVVHDGQNHCGGARPL